MHDKVWYIVLLVNFFEAHMMKFDSFFFHINLGIFIKDKSSELSLLVDRAVGGSNIMNGQLELMFHWFKFSPLL